MSVKDYYQLLELPFNANTEAIKKAYRKQAMRYHPDRNATNPFAAQLFSEVQEAYDVLSNPVKRSEYHLARWKTGLPDRAATNFTPTPVELLEQAQKMKQFVAQLDAFRMNKEALFQQLKQLLNMGHMQLLTNSGNEHTRTQFVLEILGSMQPLPYQNWLELSRVLIMVAGSNNTLLLMIRRTEQNKKQEQWLESNKPWLIVLAVGLICALIYLIA